MSHPYPPYPVSPPGRLRPRRRWFAIAAAMLVTGIVLGVTTLVLTIMSFSRTDATIAADGETEAVDLEAGTTYLVWNHPGAPDDCAVLDPATGEELDTRELGSTSYRKSGGSGTWEGVRTFETGSAQVEITCAASGGEIQVGEEPQIAGLLGGVALTLASVFLLAGGGFVLLLVVGILYATGERRPTRLTPPR